MICYVAGKLFLEVRLNGTSNNNTVRAIKEINMR